MDGSRAPRTGERVVVKTPDRREWRGVLVETRGERAVVRLDTGWVTTFPMTMVHAAL